MKAGQKISMSKITLLGGRIMSEIGPFKVLFRFPKGTLIVWNIQTEKIEKVIPAPKQLGWHDL